MTKEEAIDILFNEIDCIQSNCNRNCEDCTLAKEEHEIITALGIAIYSLSKET